MQSKVRNFRKWLLLLCVLAKTIIGWNVNLKLMFRNWVDFASFHLSSFYLIFCILLLVARVALVDRALETRGSRDEDSIVNWFAVNEKYAQPIDTFLLCSQSALYTFDRIGGQRHRRHRRGVARTEALRSMFRTQMTSNRSHGLHTRESGH